MTNLYSKDEILRSLFCLQKYGGSVQFVSRSQKTKTPENDFYDVAANPELINQIQIIRNHIAHNSYKSLKKFREKIISSYGYLPVVDADVVDVLVATNRETSKIFYNYYISQLFDLAKYLTK